LADEALRKEMSQQILQEPVECSACLAKADPDIPVDELANYGWSLNGEFGPQCPECAAENVQPQDGDGLDGVIEAIAGWRELFGRR
jgi:hypothetical protein